MRGTPSASYHAMASALLRSGSQDPHVIAQIERYWRMEARAKRREIREGRLRGRRKLADRIGLMDGRAVA
jgi:hypothetical protein